jgi:hypothetical protein
VVPGAPSMRAAPIPTIRYGTPSALSACSNARSAGVRTISKTGQTATQSFSRGEVERHQGMVDIAWVESRIRGDNGVRFTPERLTANQPRPLTRR